MYVLTINSMMIGEISPFVCVCVGERERERESERERPLFTV